jgi:signal transduction histidine kinase
MNSSFRVTGWFQTPHIKITILLFLAVLVINILAVWGIISAHRSARSTALHDLQLETSAHARSLEALLASRRGDALFLAQSRPFANVSSLFSSSNPLIRRWGRIDLEASILLFMGAHPEIERIVLRDPSGQPLLVGGRRQQFPVLLPAQNVASDDQNRTLKGIFPLDTGGRQEGTLEVLLGVPKLLAIAAPGVRSGFAIQERASIQPSSSITGDVMVVSAPIRDSGWNPPVQWTLVGRESESRLLQSIAALAVRYRTTVILNLVVITLALLVGVVAFHQVRSRVALEEDGRHQAELRRLEHQLMHNERLASVGRMAAGIAHEINNPLEGMANYLSLMEDDLQSGHTAEALKISGKVREGLDRAAGIIRQVLTFSGPGSLPSAPVELKDVLRETVQFVRSHPSFRNVDVKLETPPDELWLAGNRITLGQLFLNLMINACEAQPSGGKVEVRLSRSGQTASITVSDEGPGIPADALTRIFEPFYSAKGSAGLGLFVCHGIVGQHHGQIRAHNRRDRGAIFEVELSGLIAEQATLRQLEHRAAV